MIQSLRIDVRTAVGLVEMQSCLHGCTPEKSMGLLFP